jgi:hypothetical protein
MNHDCNHTKPEAPADRGQATRERDDAPEARADRQRRIGAAQLAAPSSRTWRRAGRFSSSG